MPGYAETILAVYLTAANLTGFILMGTDKRRAEMHRWRIPEKVLFLTAAAGGSIGAMLGMKVFRHKTKHLAFVLGMPLIFAVQAAMAAWLIFSLQNPAHP